MHHRILGGALLLILVLNYGAVASDVPVYSDQPTIVNSTDYITSPGYPDQYPANHSSAWLLQAPTTNTTKQVFIRIVDFQTNPGDVLKVYNGSNTSFPLIKAYEGSLDFALAYSNADETLVTFSSGAKGNRGFNISVNFEECLFDVDNAGQLIQGPAYVTSKTNISCLYNVNSSRPQDAVTLTFTDLHLTKGQLEVKDGAGKMIQNMTGSSSNPGELLSSGDTMSVSYSLSATVENQTFSAVYGFVDKACSRNLTLSPSAPEANISTPGGLDPRTPARCVYIVRASANTTVSLVFTAYTIAQSGVTVRDGAVGTAAEMMSSRGDNGDVSEQIFLSSGNALWVEFVSSPDSGPGSNEGFSATLRQQAFSRRVTTGSFSFGTKPYTTQNRDTTAEETILVEYEAGAGSQVTLVLDNSTRLGENTTVSVLEGFSLTGPSVASLTGPSSEVFTNGRRMLVTISGLKYVNGSFGSQYVAGTFKSVPAGSRYNSYAPSGVYSLQAGERDQRQEAKWCVHNDDQNKLVSLSVTSLSLDPTSTVTVTEGLWDTKAAQIPLVGTVPVIYLSQASLAYTSTNQTLTGPVVTATYSTVPVCSKTLSAGAGDISSPLYPNQYPYNARCDWTIPVAEKKLVYVNFTSLDLQKDHTVTLTQANKTVADYSASTLPTDLLAPVATGNHTTLRVTFSSRSPAVKVAQGFKLSYKLIESGGMLKASKGSVNSTATGTNRWIISLPTNTSKETYIVNFTYTLTGKKQGKLTLRDGPSASSPKLAVKKSGERILSRTNALWVEYVKGEKDANFTMSYSQKACDKKHQCANGLCLLDDWICNGKNDCGDGSDEINCGEKPSGKTTYAGWQLALGIVLTFILTVTLLCVAPRLIRRCRGNSYTRFGDSMAPENA